MRALTTITLSEAELVADRIIALAKLDGGSPIAVCVRDLQYRILVVKTMDGAAAESTGIAIDKSETVLRQGESTTCFTSDGWSDHDRMASAARGLTTWKGGVLITGMPDDPICCVGVSGRDEAGDHRLILDMERTIRVASGDLTLLPLLPA